MKFMAVVGILLVAGCVHALVHYEMPKAPCAWTFIQEIQDKGRYRMSKYVNGYHMIIVRESLEGPVQTKGVYRRDLVENASDEEFVKGFYYDGDRTDERYFGFDEVGVEYQPVGPDGLVYSFDFENVTDSEFQGKKCKKYINASDHLVLYADLDGYMMYFGFDDPTFQSDHINASFSKAIPPLSMFVFDKSVKFEDTRIYTPPKSTICPGQSSSSSTITLSSIFILLNMMIFFL